MSEFNLGDKPILKTTSTTPEKAKRQTLHLKAAEISQAPPEPQPESQNPVTIPPDGGINQNSNSAPLPDFDNAPLPDDEIQAPAAPVGEGSADKVSASGFMNYEAFDQLFCTTFLIAGHVTGYKTLAEAPGLSSRPDATKAMYEAILDTPSLHFIINPQSLWMQRAFAMGAFFVPVGLGVANEMREKRAPKIIEPLKGVDAAESAKAMRDSLKGR